MYSLMKRYRKKKYYVSRIVFIFVILYYEIAYPKKCIREIYFILKGIRIIIN